MFETVVKRTARQLHTDAGDLELALDEGVVRSGKAETQLCEAELELKSGTADGFLQIAAQLFGDEPVRLAKCSKADRGYDLVKGRGQDAPQARHAERVALAKTATCREALAAFVQSAAEQIAANRRVVLETDDFEGAHQLRVGLRRLRTALRAFRPLLDTPSMREMDSHARALARVAGELRDADVFIEEIYGRVAGERRGRSGLEPLKEALKAHRMQKRDTARAALRHKHWTALQLHLALWPRTIEEVESLDRPLSKFAGRALAAAWKKVGKQGARTGELECEARHEKRKSLKKLRYTVEYFGSLYGPRGVAPMRKRLKALQDIFGYVNDVRTAAQIEEISATYCPENSECQRAAGYVVGWHTAEAAHCWTGAAKDWEKLDKTRRFWD